MAAKKWHDGMYVDAFLLAKSGSSDAQIGEALGISRTVFDDWKVKKSALADALRRGRVAKDESFREFVYGRLPPPLKELWDRINLCESSPSGIERIEALLERAGLYARQHLFLYALIDSGFNASEACRKLNVSKGVLEGWKTDPRFGELMNEVHWHKGNFFENALVGKVSEGDAACIMFANKTFNRDRGYGEKVDVTINKTVKVEHSVRQEVTIRLDHLPLEAKKQILCILRENEKGKTEITSVPRGGENGQIH